MRRFFRDENFIAANAAEVGLIRASDAFGFLRRNRRGTFGCKD